MLMLTLNRILFLVGLVSVSWSATITDAATCSHPYDKKKLSYPSRQELCPNGARFVDYLTGKSMPCEDAHVDHVIPTKIMYDLGVCGTRLEQFSNDKDNLRLTFSKLNLEKSDKNPILYAARHGGDTQNKVNDIITNMAKKYPEISIEKLRDGASLSMSKELNMLYRQRNKALSVARIQQEARKRIGVRMISMLSRNTAMTAAESASVVMAPIALGVIALDLKDTCENLKDLELMDASEESNNEELLSVAEKEMCGMTAKEFLSVVGMDLKLNTCVKARRQLGKLNPPECDGISFDLPEFMKSTDDTSSSPFDIPIIE
jgi:hypothetical protein